MISPSYKLCFSSTFVYNRPSQSVGLWSAPHSLTWWLANYVLDKSWHRVTFAIRMWYCRAVPRGVVPGLLPISTIPPVSTLNPAGRDDLSTEDYQTT